jgi:D-galactarolactone cycloisomerase
MKRLKESIGIQLINADLACCGSPSEALKIKSLASANGLNMIPHVWEAELNLAVATHFLATVYSEIGREETKPFYLEYVRTENPLRDE